MSNPDLGEKGAHLSAQQARQGRKGWPIITVLVVSTLLVIVAFAAIWLYHAPGLSGGGGQVQAPAAGGSTPYMPARQTPAAPPPSQPIAR